jgi:hypothetical protein
MVCGKILKPRLIEAPRWPLGPTFSQVNAGRVVRLRSRLTTAALSRVGLLVVRDQLC